MTQTKFVLSKALKAKLKPIVVLNKMDVLNKVRVDEVETEVILPSKRVDMLLRFLTSSCRWTPVVRGMQIHLFANSEQQMDYPTLYASARDGWANLTRDGNRQNMSDLLDAIVKHGKDP
jgi:GTP-binding protein